MLTRAGARTAGGGLGVVLGLVLAAVALLVAGCGVPLQDEPAPLQDNPAPPTTSSSAGGRNAVQVYLVRDGRLTPVTRASDDTSAGSLVALLADGPTAAEEAEGATTAVVPGDFVVEEPSPGRAPDGSVVISVPVQFTQVDGDLQLLATAQLVWTATEPQPRGTVRMTFEGEPIELPTDGGLTSGAVRRSDFRSVAPRGARGGPSDAG